MFCKKCGKEMKTGASFCEHCGTPVKQAGAAPSQSGGYRPAGSMGTPNHMGKGIVIGGIILVVVLIAAVILFLFPGFLRRGQSEGNDEMLEASGDAAQSFGESVTGAKEPLYFIEDMGIIYPNAPNHEPGTKQAGMVWDSSLFYWLEDADTLSPDDGNIDHCRVSRTFLRDGESGGLIQYEIYSDPDDGEIYKIVSIQEKEGKLELTDYYYADGNPNFIFLR